MIQRSSWYDTQIACVAISRFGQLRIPINCDGAVPGSSVCRKWRVLTSDDELWRKLFNDRWGADAAAFYAPEGSKSWKDVFAVQDRCDRYGL